MMPLSCLDIFLVSTRSGGATACLRPSMATRKCGCTRSPPLIMGVNAVASWMGVVATPCPKERLARSTGAHGTCRGSGAMPDDLTRQVDARPLADAQLVPRLVERDRGARGRPSQAGGDLGHGHVAGVRHHVLERDLAHALAVRVADHGGPEPDAATVEDRGSRRDDPVLECRRRGEHLHHGARLVELADDRIEQQIDVVGRHLARVVGVITRHRGPCQDLPAVGVHHQPAHALGLVGHPRRIQLLLQLQLEAGVDADGDVLAVGARFEDLRGAERPAELVPGGRHLLGSSGQDVVVLALDAVVAGAVAAADEPEELAGKGRVRLTPRVGVDAHGMRQQDQPAQRRVRDAGTHRAALVVGELAPDGLRTWSVGVKQLVERRARPASSSSRIVGQLRDGLGPPVEHHGRARPPACRGTRSWRALGRSGRGCLPDARSPWRCAAAAPGPAPGATAPPPPASRRGAPPPRTRMRTWRSGSRRCASAGRCDRASDDQRARMREG